MATPDLSLVLRTCNQIQRATSDAQFRAARSTIHHALYYHDKGWQLLSTADLATCYAALQCMNEYQLRRAEALRWRIG